MEIKSLVQVGEYEWEIPRSGQMRVPARIFASRELLEEMDEKVREQLSNVATLPGIVGAALAMPDAHWGYGFPIGGVAAFDPAEGGIISVGGVGYDISCGVRTLLTGLKKEQIEPVLETLIEALFVTIPAGVGSEGKIKLSPTQLDEVLVGGARWAVEKGYGLPEDLDYIEENGSLPGADPACVSMEAKKRQYRQIGTLGSGNHYLEVQYVAQIYDHQVARAFGLAEDDVIISIHCGSRALGHQIATDYLRVLSGASRKYGIPIREKELVCAPIDSPEGQRYYKAMACGVNCALANRQVISHLVREVFAEVVPEANIRVLYDVSHNTCKIEEHEVAGRRRRLYVHRKGSTRAFGPGRPELPQAYRKVGQPVIIGGTMGTCSYILVGTTEGTTKAFGSACHGAGRAMSRHAAKKRWRGSDVIQHLARQGIVVRAKSMRGVAEEAPLAYKDVSKVVEATHLAGLAKKVAMVKPLGVIKG
ncbi:RtcB family protein [Thermosulfuriphilus ammonigenes]|uniref:tRNA-splicing ligase RtcB n=1 Tax=Thermosulfuriphilus ammonigenes TaxID=1936021 RepID=A0A6G7PXS4_9BACT|nr:RtcB family protein [Thermosulfuriphilus ammonigenes]MBA2849653.1 tRNA-splicing ligase RtcB [Thermosulfuriphilus ammonigenes]QIJ72248.1 RtcB family protein [Thermosulfuriphilus ammonigenes]